ncbi:hypothetical protein P6U16_23425 (plasmid) [Rhizobium sp. 32-5/1]|uniref:hypothetical protein n=1 Tax=Rhizobium sp. 32-5/1 TaxID=3019602 RepID=UPI00240D5515|nr:hypothetical protein [Rhizobium sp. 32-5/1]WEZ86039.1 hypothetical protein P6U16_23425 [Rhizobium sp. 32-5/1]
MSKKPAALADLKISRPTRKRGEKISAVEGLQLNPRMRALLDTTKDKPGEERRRLIRAQFSQKSA